jgi:chemotaxis protein CheD
MTTTFETGTKASVGMGQILVARPPDSLTSVLGSCIGVAMHHSRTKLGILAHVVLPDSAGREGSLGKYADTAIAEMLRIFNHEGIAANTIVARLTGGANMFGSSNGPLQIGEQNIVGQHLGGNKGRRITFNCETGAVTIEIVGSHTETI